jgi:hypothetical protein
MNESLPDVRKVVNGAANITPFDLGFDLEGGEELSGGMILGEFLHLGGRVIAGEDGFMLKAPNFIPIGYLIQAGDLGSGEEEGLGISKIFILKLEEEMILV